MISLTSRNTIQSLKSDLESKSQELKKVRESEEAKTKAFSELQASFDQYQERTTKQLEEKAAQLRKFEEEMKLQGGAIKKSPEEITKLEFTVNSLQEELATLKESYRKVFVPFSFLHPSVPDPFDLHPFYIGNRKREDPSRAAQFLLPEA